MRSFVVLEEAAEDIESLGLFHGIHSKHFGFHRLLSERFPFGIYYRETPTATEVFAILDLRKNPIWIHKKLKRRNKMAPL